MLAMLKLDSIQIIDRIHLDQQVDKLKAEFRKKQ